MTLRFHSWLVAILVLLNGTSAEAFEVRRAINIAQWFTWPRYEPSPGTGILWPPYKEEPKPPESHELRALKAAGFDTVRLPVDPAPFIVFQNAQRETVYRRLFDAIGRMRSAGLQVIVDLHPNSRHPVWGQHAVAKGRGSQAFDALADLAEEMARRLASQYRSQVALELINEPRLKCKGEEQEKWEDMQGELVRRARKGASDMTLVVTGACVSSLEGLIALDPRKLKANNLIFTFHFYDPFSFTHQGAQFIPWPDKYLDEVPWPASERPIDQPLAKTLQRVAEARLDEFGREKAAIGAQANLNKFYKSRADRNLIRTRFLSVAEWAKQNGVDPHRVLIGEFGVLKKKAGLPGALCMDRMRWLRDVQMTADEFGFSWAYFSFDGPFAIVSDGPERELDGSVLAALRMSNEQPPCRD